MRADFAAHDFLLKQPVANGGLVTFPSEAGSFDAFLQIVERGQAVLLAHFVQALGQVCFDADAHVFRALHDQRLVNQAAQQILLLLFELRVNLVLRAALAIVRRFVAQLLFGFLIIGKRDDVVVYARDDVSVR